MTTALLEAPTPKATKGITPTERRPRRKHLPCAPGQLQAIEYIYNPCFDDPKAVAAILGPLPDQEEYEQKCSETHVPKGVTLELTAAYTLPLLDREQEMHLFRQMNYYRHLVMKAHAVDDKQGYKKHSDLATSLHKLITGSNTRLVYNYVKGKGLIAEAYYEATQDAMFPLMNSVLKFDYSRGLRFSTYCTYALRNWWYRYAELLGRQATSNVGDDFLIAVGGTEENAEPEESDLAQRQRVLVRSIMSKLNDREEKVVRLRKGLGPVSPNGKTEWTLGEVGKELKITKERVRQIQVTAFKKMRDLKPHELRGARHVLARFGFTDAQ